MNPIAEIKKKLIWHKYKSSLNLVFGLDSCKNFIHSVEIFSIGSEKACSRSVLNVFRVDLRYRCTYTVNASAQRCGRTKTGHPASLFLAAELAHPAAAAAASLGCCMRRGQWLDAAR